MRRRWTTALLATVLTVVTAAAQPSAAQAAAACTYPVTVLPIPSTAYGAVVQTSGGEDYFAGSTSTGAGRALRWHGTALTDLGMLAGASDSTAVYDVNASGTVVGYGYEITGYDEDGWAYGVMHPFRSVGDHLEMLPVPAGVEDVYARHVLDNGDIYGQNDEHLYRWPAASPGTVEELTGLPPHKSAYMVGADQDGTLAINIDDPATNLERGYLWKNGVSTQVATPAGADGVILDEIHNGRILGRGMHLLPDYWDKPAYWDVDGTVKYLDGNAYIAFAMNGSGLISGIDTANKNAILWQGAVRKQTLPAKTVKSVLTITDGGTLGGWGGPNLDKPIIMHCN